MSTVVTGSIAIDHLSFFEGRFRDQFVAAELDHLALSFLVSSVDIRRGGVAANISIGMARLGQEAVLLGAAGADFAEYRAWLEENGVDTDSVHVHEDVYTARFNGTSDVDGAQIATFYPGAMERARDIEIRPVADRLDSLDLVVIGPNDPQAMLRHSDECRSAGYPFAADPSQQVAVMEGAGLRRLVPGATYLFTNEYERALLMRKTGWSEGEILDGVGTWVTTLGAAGARLETRDAPPVTVRAVPTPDEVDPTGVGDGFRAGFLSGVRAGLSPERAAQLGNTLASLVLRVRGPQDYHRRPRQRLERLLATTYGEAAAAEVAGALSLARTA